MLQRFKTFSVFRVKKNSLRGSGYFLPESNGTEQFCIGEVNNSLAAFNIFQRSGGNVILKRIRICAINSMEISEISFSESTAELEASRPIPS